MIIIIIITIIIIIIIIIITIIISIIIIIVIIIIITFILIKVIGFTSHFQTGRHSPAQILHNYLFYMPLHRLRKRCFCN